MKKLSFLALAVGLLLTGTAFADSLVVNGAAAMEGANGLDVFHDNTSKAYVQDDSPSAETIYRASFLFNPNGISPETGNFRQTIFMALMPNPNPGVGACSANAGQFYSALRVFLYLTGGSGQVYNVQLWGRGNQCGEASTKRIPVSSNGTNRICLEYTTGPSLGGSLALAVVNGTGACPATGDASYETVNMSNNRTQIDFVRLGTPQQNSFGRGESGSMYFDDFQSFRTLTP